MPVMKARAGDVLLFGLSELNLQRLREGKPIAVDLAELGMQGRLVIFYGKTEAAMRAELADLIGPDTDFKDTTGSAH